MTKTVKFCIFLSPGFMFCGEDQRDKNSQSYGNSDVCHAFIIFAYKQRPSFELDNCGNTTETYSEILVEFGGFG